MHDALPVNLHPQSHGRCRFLSETHILRLVQSAHLFMLLNFAVVALPALNEAHRFLLLFHQLSFNEPRCCVGQKVIFNLRILVNFFKKKRQDARNDNPVSERNTARNHVAREH
jgi:hypothetical protein